MDAVANVEEQRELAESLYKEADESFSGEPVSAIDVMRLCELVTALDEWRRAGGFDPYSVEVDRRHQTS